MGASMEKERGKDKTGEIRNDNKNREIKGKAKI